MVSLFSLFYNTASYMVTLRLICHFSNFLFFLFFFQKNKFQKSPRNFEKTMSIFNLSGKDWNSKILKIFERKIEINNI
jgi:hypothetical protein